MTSVASQADQPTAADPRSQATGEALEQLVATAEHFRRLYEGVRDGEREAELVAALRASREARAGAALALHDTAGQSLVGAHRFLEAATAALARSDAAGAARHVDEAGRAVTAAIRELRAVMDDLAGRDDGDDRR